MNASLDLVSLPETLSPHRDFLPLYPVIQRHAMVVFRHLPAVEREEATAEAVAAGFASFVRLKNRGKDPSAFPSALATFAALHVKNGRHVGSKFNSRDIMSGQAWPRRGIRRQQMLQEESRWHDLLADDSVTPIPDQVGFKIDWTEFLNKQSPRHRRIIHLLSMGHAAKSVARMFKLSPGRVTQLRKEWRRQWQAFLGEANEHAKRICPTQGSG